MKRLLLTAALLAAFPVVCPAQKTGPHEAEWRTFYAAFLAAVKANDKEKIADLMSFPIADWSVERNHNVSTVPIKDRAEFLAKYPLFFTASMRLHAPRAKVTALQDGNYALIWSDTDSEFSFDFEYRDGGYRLISYGIGPR